MKELTVCPVCKMSLVSHELVHAVGGTLYCSKACAVKALTDDIILNAKEMAIEQYNDTAEVVESADILRNELQEVRITVTCSKIIKLPVSMSETVALETASHLYQEGLVEVEPAECDESSVKCELVKDNSSHIEGHTLWEVQDE